VTLGHGNHNIHRIEPAVDLVGGLGPDDIGLRCWLPQKDGPTGYFGQTLTTLRGQNKCPMGV
jgi:hypothetical protein